MSVIDVENQKIDSLLGTDVPLLDANVTSPEGLAALQARWNELTAVPVFAESRMSGTDHSFADLDVRTLLRGEQSAGRFAVHSVVLRPGAEFPAHYTDDTHSYFLVTEGQIELGIGSAHQMVGAHSLGYAPPLTHQSIHNTTDEPATVIMVHSPAGTDRAFHAAHERWTQTGARDVLAYSDLLEPYGIRFDDRALENDDRTNNELVPVQFEIKAVGDMDRLRQVFASRPAVPRLVATNPTEYDATTAGVTRRKELLNGDVSAGTAMFNMLAGVPGMNAPAHHQPTEEEFFFVTSGRLTVTCANATKVVTGGAFAFAPRNCTHGFSNDAEIEARFVTLNSPAGHERSLAMLRRLAEQKASKEQIAAAAAAGGWIVHDPDALVAPRN